MKLQIIDFQNKRTQRKINFLLRSRYIILPAVFVFFILAILVTILYLFIHKILGLCGAFLEKLSPALYVFIKTNKMFFNFIFLCVLLALFVYYSFFKL